MVDAIDKTDNDTKSKAINSPTDLKVYKAAYELAMLIFRVSKLTDVDGENSETETWLNFARDCGYLNEENYLQLSTKCRLIGKMLGSMLRNPKPFIIKTDT